MPIYLSLKLNHVGHPLSNLRLCYLPHVSYLSDEACAHRVHVYCSLFTELSSCRRSFFDWATPVKLCSSVFCMLIDCLLHQFLGSIQEKVRVLHRMHVILTSKTGQFTGLYTCNMWSICRGGRLCHFAITWFGTFTPVGKINALCVGLRLNDYRISSGPSILTSCLLHCRPVLIAVCCTHFLPLLVLKRKEKHHEATIRQ